MSEAKVVSAEGLQQLKDIQVAYERITKHYGELFYQKKLLERELSETEGMMEQLEAQRVEVTSKLQQDFGGPGTVNLETGEFIPATS